MANGNNRVFVSPGVYTSEKDLSFVAQSVGVTTLGLVGETKKGPAFEPIFVSNYSDFTTRFGSTSADKFVDTQIPKHELAFIAKSYLSQSNQLFVTRVLGLNGYDAGPSWSITTIGEVDPLYVSAATSAQTTSNWSDIIYIPMTSTTATPDGIYLTYNSATGKFSDPITDMTTFGGANFPIQNYQLTGQTFINGYGTTLGTFIDEITSFVNTVNGGDNMSWDGSGLSQYWYYGVLGTGTTVGGEGANSFCEHYANTWMTGNTSGLSIQAIDHENRLAVDASNFYDDQNDGWYDTLFEYEYGEGANCYCTSYSGSSFDMFGYSALTAQTYIDEVDLSTSGASTFFAGGQFNNDPTSGGTSTEWSGATGVNGTGGQAVISFTATSSGGPETWAYRIGSTSANATGVVANVWSSLYQTPVGTYDSIGPVTTHPYVPSDFDEVLSGGTASTTTVLKSNPYPVPLTPFDFAKSGTTCDTSIGAYSAVSVIYSGFGNIGSLVGGNLGGAGTGFDQGNLSSGISHTFVGFSGADGPNSYSGTLAVNMVFYSADCQSQNLLTLQLSGCAAEYQNVSADTEYHNLVVATMRARGQSSLSTGGPVYTISGSSSSSTGAYGDVTFNCLGAYQPIVDDPFFNFGISARTDGGATYNFDVSMNTSSKNYLPKVLGRNVFDKKMEEVPIFVEEVYPNILKYGFNRNRIRGLNCCLLKLPAARWNNTGMDSIGWYMQQWQTPETPYVVSELRGEDVYRLFKFVSISDGTEANREYKVSIINISFERLEFDVLVRDFYDSDASPVVYEKFTRCSLDPSLPSFIGRKIGTSDGQYELRSKYTMLYLTEEVLDGTLKDAVPAGFDYYDFRNYENGAGKTCRAIPPMLKYKTKYFTAGEVVYDPPYDNADGSANSYISPGDNVRKTYLGISDTVGAAIDFDFFEYKGKKTPVSVCTDVNGVSWGTIRKGFHMDSGATIIVAGSGTYITQSGTTLSGDSIFEVGAADFRGEPASSNHPYKKLNSRKFTLAPYGGFDGWDEYRKFRSNGDSYRLGLQGFLNGACNDAVYPSAVGDGSFKALSSTEANTDYFAYLRGVQTFQNPEAVNINVFATPGIDYVNNQSLVKESIDMVESQRADSLYITTTPDFNMYVPTSSDVTNQISPTEAGDNLEDSLIDSNYTATYYPWILVRDDNSNKQIYIPPTSEVTRNLALTDNVAFPWFASAGYTRGLVNAQRARRKLTQDERDTLYVDRINPIATFSDVGPIIFGQKTLQIKESALDRINVRRLLLQTRKLISAVAVRLLFEQNDDVVRQQFLDLVNPILDSIRRDRGLTDFRVVLSNDPEEIDRNELNGKIYLKPTRALEFIFIEFLITPTGAEFESV
tara:strand:+ start:14631 stop:18716 length:4086 start_codon:yes stop_codon:yes gene_type:complete